jgi:S-adenosylmethionine decarboxylase
VGLGRRRAVSGTLTQRGSHHLRTLEDMVYGLELVLDLDGCDPEMIGNRHRLAAFAGGMVATIGMKAYGDPILEHFGHDDPITSGWTLVQLIETSSITGHFSDHLRRAHLNVFSCRLFDTDAALGYAARYLSARKAVATVLFR